MARKQSSPRASTIAGEVLGRDKRPDGVSPYWWTRMRTLAASVLAQDEKAAIKKAALKFTRRRITR